MNSEFSHKRPTIHDVARLAGLSIATVSRFINGTAVVSDEGAERIRRAIEDLQYLPNTGARGLASHRTQTLGLLLPTISGNFYAPLLSGVETRAIETGYSLLVHSTQLASRTPFKKILAEHNTDGLLIFADSLDDAEQSAPAKTNIACVTVDNNLGTFQLMNHFIEVHGRRRIVHLRGEERHEDAIMREQGYRKALQAHNIPFNHDLVVMGGFNTEVARQSMQVLIKKGTQFDAIFAADDESASGAMMALREAGLRVPEDVVVAGFDDLNLAVHLTPPLTTVHSPIEQVAYLATDLLIRRIAGDDIPHETSLPTHLVIRSSCGCTA
jgi:LacI family transcriptional regulator